MRVLLTGGAGFIGHHLIEHIWKYTDWHVVSLDRLDTSGTLTRIADIESFPQNSSRLTVVHHDLKAEFNEFVVKKIGEVDVIIHMAAASHVDRSIDDPLSFAQDNVIGTVNILNYARKYAPKARFLYFSTDEVFGPAPKGTYYKEDDRYKSANPYAASKAGAEEFCVAFANTYRMNLQITHTMNVFGERQHPEKFIPKIISRALNGELLQIHSDSTKTIPGSRFYIHARNVSSALVHIINNIQTAPGYGEKFNIVGEKEVNNLSLALMVAGFVGKELKWELTDFHSSRPGHDLRYALSGEKMKFLGWVPPMSFEKSLESTVKWTLKHKERWLL